MSRIPPLRSLLPSPLRRFALFFLPAALVGAEPAGVRQARPGPWGHLEYTRILIEPPDEFLAPDYKPADTKWDFRGYDRNRLTELFRKAGLAGDRLRDLADPAAWEASPAGIVVRPAAAAVLDLGADARAALYNALAVLPGNNAQSVPFRIRADVADEWFEGSDVAPGTVALVRRLLYRRGNSLLFSDISLVLPTLATPAERVALVKTLARKSTLLLKLRVDRDSPVDALADYWGRGPRRKDVRPLLQSIARQPGGMTLDVAHLLPRFARGLLYTYPPPDQPAGANRDCHWTSMNFFNDPPDERFADIGYLKQVLVTDYEPVRGERALGDVLVVTRPDGEIVHSCAYVADDIVFTKNGYSFSIPWTLSTIPDMLAAYPSEVPLEIHAFRRKAK